MNRWLLDTSALLALRDDEGGAEQVADMLAQTQRGEFACETEVARFFVEHGE
jgi:PIN domain nuclease of toxin-antitoxin system